MPLPSLLVLGLMSLAARIPNSIWPVNFCMRRSRPTESAALNCATWARTAVGSLQSSTMSRSRDSGRESPHLPAARAAPNQPALCMRRITAADGTPVNKPGCRPGSGETSVIPMLTTTETRRSSETVSGSSAPMASWLGVGFGDNAPNRHSSPRNRPTRPTHRIWTLMNTEDLLERTCPAIRVHRGLIVSVSCFRGHLLGLPG